METGYESSETKLIK